MRALIISLLLLVAPPALAEAVYEDARTGAVFPRTLGAFAFDKAYEYELAKLGYSLNYYAEPEHTAASVYVYTGGQNVPEGIGSQTIRAQFQMEIQTIEYAKRVGKYKEVTLLPNTIVQRPDFLSASLLIEGRNGNRAVSHLFLRGEAGHFLKVRLSTTAGEDITAKINTFLDALIAAIRAKRS